MVERDRPLVDVMDRADERTWATARRIEGLDSVLELPPIDISIALRVLYHRALTT